MNLMKAIIKLVFLSGAFLTTANAVQAAESTIWLNDIKKEFYGGREHKGVQRHHRTYSPLPGGRFSVGAHQDYK